MQRLEKKYITVLPILEDPDHPRYQEIKELYPDEKLELDFSKMIP
jgi:hypothetical protein